MARFPLISPDRASPQFREKSPEIQQLINEALYLLERFGVPMSGLSARRLERMGLAFLAVADMKRPGEWNRTQDVTEGRSMKTRDIIEFVNEHFGENISSGSYDDIRRKDLLLPVLAGIVIQTNPEAARNDPQRGYAISAEYSPLVRAFGSPDWEREVQEFLANKKTLASQLEVPRSIHRISVTLPSDKKLEFGAGEHNRLIKAIIEEFLPRYGYGAEVLYVGDAERRLLHVEEERLRELNFFELGHGELPDVVGYSRDRNWLYLIEAVHTTGAISPTRHLQLRRLTKDCAADIVFVTAFLDKDAFRRFAGDIAWESEVWIADAPDHLVHFDGAQFLGPYTRLTRGAKGPRS